MRGIRVVSRIRSEDTVGWTIKQLNELKLLAEITYEVVPEPWR